MCVCVYMCDVNYIIYIILNFKIIQLNNIQFLKKLYHY